jgi:hypothetical protein
MSARRRSSSSVPARGRCWSDLFCEGEGVKEGRSESDREKLSIVSEIKCASSFQSFWLAARSLLYWPLKQRFLGRLEGPEPEPSKDEIVRKRKEMVRFSHYITFLGHYNI